MNLIKRAGVYRELAILTAMLILTALLSFSARAEEAESQHERVRVGFFAMDGYHMMDEDGNRSGYGYDFLRLMARYWDADYEYIGYDKSWEDMQQMLLDGEIDMVTSASKTPDREELFDFSRPIGTSNDILTIRGDNTAIVEGQIQYLQWDACCTPERKLPECCICRVCTDQRLYLHIGLFRFD